MLKLLSVLYELELYKPCWTIRAKTTLCLNAVLIFHQLHSQSFGNNSFLGDERWGGFYGIEAEFVAVDNCKICCFEAKIIKVLPTPFDS